MSERKNINKEDLLKPENMILMYARGAFPMADKKGELNWYFPETRTIIPLESYNFPRTLRKFMSISDLEYRYDYDIISVILNCAKRKETWISSDLINAYKKLIPRGNLHSVEVYKNNKLIGGLFGVTYRGAFFGESMFSHISQASKAALIKLIERLNEKQFALLDVQFQTPHLEMFGTIEISLEEYEMLLMKAYSKDVSFK